MLINYKIKELKLSLLADIYNKLKLTDNLKNKWLFLNINDKDDGEKVKAKAAE